MDDTDSPNGGCTTYTASRIIDNLAKEDPRIQFHGFPKLIRLNPNVPFKTRGNGALAISFSTSLTKAQICEIVVDQIQTDTRDNLGEDLAQPSAVLTDREIPFSYDVALRKFVDFRSITVDPDVLVTGRVTRGIVGCLSALAARLEDKTYELITYRKPENLGKPRKVSKESVRDFVLNHPGSTFSSYDFVNNRELIAPAGPDPVLYGVRGESPEGLLQVKGDIEVAEDIHSWTIFETNQGTDAHVKLPHFDTSEYSVISAECEVVDNPVARRGGHTFMKCRFKTSVVDVVAFEPTKGLAKLVQKLLPGDRIYVHGAMKKSIISLERVRVISLVTKVATSPKCRICGGQTRSKGRYSGFRCIDCGDPNPNASYKDVDRCLHFGQVIYAAKSAQRHLTRPWEREYVRNKYESGILSYSQIRYLP